LLHGKYSGVLRISEIKSNEDNGEDRKNEFSAFINEVFLVREIRFEF